MTACCLAVKSSVKTRVYNIFADVKSKRRYIKYRFIFIFVKIYNVR